MIEPSPQKKDVRPISGKIDLKPGKAAQEPAGLQPALQAAGTALQKKDYKTFSAEIAKAEKLAPQNAYVLHFKGLYQFEQQNARGAFQLVGQALKKRPRDPAMQHNLAAILISLGKFEEAEKLLLSAIALKPDYAEAFHTLSPIHQFSADDPLIPKMEKGLKTKGLTATDTSFYAFALAKAEDDAGRPEKAWAALEIGNPAMGSFFKHNPAAERNVIASIEGGITRKTLEDLAPYGHQSRAPIFVVGMPRSGTTLLESTIAAHPQVLAAGELTALGAVGKMASKRLGTTSKAGYADLIGALTPEHQHAAAQGYLNAAFAKQTGWVDHFVDKLPDNSFNLGLAAALLPNAQVVHIMRHPLDVMLSIYFQRFTSVQYAFDPDHIVGHWKAYDRAMAHWRKTLPLNMIELRYENLVQDRDFAQAKLWEALGLSTQVNHVSTAPRLEEQRTASRFQVKQPVYQTSREKFRKYEPHMGAFIEAMGGMEAIEAEVDAQEARCFLRSMQAA